MTISGATNEPEQLLQDPSPEYSLCCQKWKCCSCAHSLQEFVTYYNNVLYYNIQLIKTTIKILGNRTKLVSITKLVMQPHTLLILTGAMSVMFYLVSLIVHPSLSA